MSTRQIAGETTEQKIARWAAELEAAHPLANRPDASEADHRAFGSSFARLSRGWGHARSVGKLADGSLADMAARRALALRITQG